MKRLLLSVLMLPLLGACSTIVNDANQPVTIDTPDCPGAMCTLANDDNTYIVNRTPGTVTVDKEFGALTIVCSKDGKEHTQVIKSSVDPWIFGNIVFGGIIGAAVDIGTGTGFKYLPVVNNSLRCTGS